MFGDRLRRWAMSAVEDAAKRNVANIERLIDPGDASVLVDLGCDDGSLTVRLAARAGATEVHGVEIVEERARIAAERGIRISSTDLNEALPYANGTFDLVCSNQVIEHLLDTDLFVREIKRVLKPGGYAVVSTENLASWHNIASLLAGWQPFSLVNVSHQHGSIGNPLAAHRGERFPWKSWEHVRVFAYRGLADLFSVHGLGVEAMVGAGYFPLPARVGRWDPRHAAFITTRVRKGTSNG
jgi:SAM-dependent methyltransferase